MSYEFSVNEIRSWQKSSGERRTTPLASGGTGLGCERKGRCAGWGLTRSAEGLSAEPDLVGALEVFDEGVGTEGGVLASGTAEVGGFAASEGGEGLLPTSGRWPALLELVDVQPARGLHAAEMSGGGGPKGRHRRSGPCERGRRSTQRNGERFANGHVLDARVETVLPNVANGKPLSVTLS